MTQADKAAEARLARYKDQSRRLHAQKRDVDLAGAKTMATLLAHGYTKTRLAELWATSRGQVDEMLERAAKSLAAGRGTTWRGSSPRWGTRRWV